MAILNNIPFNNVKFSDVRDTLSVKGKVNNNLSSLFKKEANINKWAKGKPIPINTVMPLDKTAREYFNYGLTFKKMKEFDANKSNVGVDYTSYIDGYPVRLGDFRGYAPNAVYPCKITFPDFLDTYKTKSTIEIEMDYDYATNNAIFFKDLKDIKDKYISILVHNITKNKSEVFPTKMTPQQLIDNGIFTINIGVPMWWEKGDICNMYLIATVRTDGYEPDDLLLADSEGNGMKTNIPIISTNPTDALTLTDIIFECKFNQYDDKVMILSMVAKIKNDSNTPYNLRAKIRIDGINGQKHTWDYTQPVEFAANATTPFGRSFLQDNLFDYDGSEYRISIEFDDVNYTLHKYIELMYDMRRKTYEIITQ